MPRPPSKGFAPNEYAVMQAVSDNPGQTQRNISKRVNLSLGMTNLLLVRLTRKGYIKMRQLDWKRTEYLLTLKGALEKSRKSYEYTLHTIRLFRQIVVNVQGVIKAEYDAGLREAVVVAWPETQTAVTSAVAELNLSDLRIEYVETFGALGARPGVVFIATEQTAPKPAPEQRHVRLLDAADLKFNFPS